MGFRIRTEKKEHEVEIVKGSDTATFWGTPMDPVEYSKLIKKHTKTKNKHGQLTEKTDFTALTIDKVQKVISRWDILDERGAVLECSDENKKKAWILNADLINEVMEKFQAIADGTAEMEALEVKNSESGLTGNSRPTESPAKIA